MASKRSYESPSLSAGSSKKSRVTPERELSPCDISSPETNATVKGMVMLLSPTKPDGNVFFGELRDGDAVIPLVGFDRRHREFLRSHMDNSKPVTLKGCQISNNRTTGKLQVVIKSYTKLEESDDKDLQIETTDTLDTLPISIKQLDNMEPYDRATLQIQVMKVKSPTTVTGGK
jgi:hypothetical protein